ncbi:MAG: hypothetical protein JXA24_05400 [Proteobacteria bacterium]|nr:hypothetical protein [Pseudomonadota bacterium]
MRCRGFMLIVAFVVAIFGGCSRAGGDADRWFGRDRNGCFEEMVEGIAETQIVSQDGLRRLGTTWEIELERAGRRFSDARTRDDVYYALLSLKNSYHDLHSRLRIRDEFLPDRKPVELPLKLRVESGEGGYEYVVIESSDDAVSAGSVLVSVDGRPPAQLEEEFREWHESSSPEHLKFETAKWLVSRDPLVSPAPEVGESTAFEFRDPDTGTAMKTIFRWAERRSGGGERAKGRGAAEVLWTPLIPDDYRGRTPEFVGINYGVYPTARPDVKIVRYHSFRYRFDDAVALWNRLPELSYRPMPLDPQGPGTRELATADQRELLGYLKRRGARTVIFDVRENGGGNLNPWFIARLADRPFSIGTRYLHRRPVFEGRSDWTDDVDMGSDFMAEHARRFFRDNPGALVSPEYPFFCTTERCEAGEAVYRPEEGGRPFDLVVLTGPYCASSCDQFVAIMKGNNIATTAGLPPRAAQNPYYYERDFSLRDGTRFSISMAVGISVGADGRDQEGNPPDIDIHIPPSRENRGDYLGFAVSKIMGDRSGAQMP